MKRQQFLVSATLLIASLPSCFAQTAAPSSPPSKSDSAAQTKQEKQDKKAAKANAKTTTNRPAKVATTPSQDAAYALSHQDEAPKQSSQPPK
jgi:hypothetical protein